MSLSVEERQANLEFALKQLVGLVGDDWVGDITFRGEDRENQYEGVLSTTWNLLAQRGYIKDDNFLFFLTGLGWLHGMLHLGKKDDVIFQQQYGKVAGCLKQVVKGRHDEFEVKITDVAEATEVPVGLIANMVESNIFRWFYNSNGAIWAARGFMVKIPRDFGLEIL